MGDDYQSNYSKGYHDQSGTGPGYHMGQADRRIAERQRRATEFDQRQKAERARNRDQADQPTHAERLEPEVSLYEAHPRLEKLANILAIVFLLVGGTLGAAAAIQSEQITSAVGVVISSLIFALVCAAVGRAIPWVVVMTVGLAVGLAFVAIGLGVIVAVVVIVIVLLRAL